MNRPLWETGADRQREAAAAAGLAVAWSCEMVPAPPLSGFDYLAIRGGLVLAVIEIKSRLNRDPADYGGVLFLNVHKRDSLAAAAGRLGARRAIFAWHFPAEIRWVDIAGLADRAAEERGRADRDGRDVHPVLRVDLAETGRVLLGEAGGSPSGLPTHIIGSD